MKLNAGQVFAAVETINKLAAVKLPIKGKYGIGRIAAKLGPEYQVVSTQRDELIRKHGEEKDGKIILETTSPAYAECITDLNLLMTQDIEVDCPRVKLVDLGDGETDVDLTPLLPFIDDEVEA